MNLNELKSIALNKSNFITIQNYIDFCSYYLEFISTNLQAVIVSRNETHYRFYQYKEDGTFNVTRPINSNIMLSLDQIPSSATEMFRILSELEASRGSLNINGDIINSLIYTCQQSIGATLDALPAKKSNSARKINGDLFERLILLILQSAGISVSPGNISVPIGNTGQSMSYQHDLIITDENIAKAIGSVKTSSKDRIDKIFVDKYLYNRLTDTNTPHFAIFLNDVQRKGKEGRYSINATFLSGHFIGYTITLNPLDGVYYFDIRPNMINERILREHIKKFDSFLLNDVWRFLR